VRASEFVTSYLAPFSRYHGVLVTFSLLMHSSGGQPREYRYELYIVKNERVIASVSDPLGYIFVSDSMSRALVSKAW